MLERTIGELHEDALLKKEPLEAKPDVLGMVVEGLSEELAHSLEMETGKGVVVQAVEPGSIAERAGIARGDVLEELNDRHLRNVREYRDMINALRPSKPAEANPDGRRVILALVRRKEGTRYATLLVD